MLLSMSSTYFDRGLANFQCLIPLDPELDGSVGFQRTAWGASLLHTHTYAGKEEPLGIVQSYDSEAMQFCWSFSVPRHWVARVSK